MMGVNRIKEGTRVEDTPVDIRVDIRVDKVREDTVQEVTHQGDTVREDTQWEGMRLDTK